MNQRENQHADGEHAEALVDVSQLSFEEVERLDDSVLASALRRHFAEAEEAEDPVAAFGAFNQHGSSPW